MSPMKIISRYVREQRRYTKNDLRNLFVYDEAGVESFIRRLKSYNILKAVRNSTEQQSLSELVDEDVQIADETEDNDKFLYVFTYVGIITYGNRIIMVYPKYLLSNDKPLKEMKKVVQVLEKYNNSSEQIISSFNGDGKSKSLSFLSIILFLLNDYHEDGIYDNTEDIIEINGEGEILWDRTIDCTFPFIKNNRPYYTQLYTHKATDNEEDYFKMLHEFILTDCSNWLKQSQLSELFDIELLNLSENELDFFGDQEYILSRIQSELDIQFNTRKQGLLKAMYAYVSRNRKISNDVDALTMYGTKAFNLVWERACSEVFNNQIQTPLGKLKLPKPLVEFYNEKQSLKDVIGKPIWQSKDVCIEAKDTLIPDIVTVNDHQLVILDAKYYNLRLEKGKVLSGNPGIGDVTKQYLYQLAYQKFVEEHEFTEVKNCFLMPTEMDRMIEKGAVTLEMFSPLQLAHIQVRLMPATTIFDYYLSGRKYSINDLNL